MNPRSLTRALVVVLLAGTVFAWGNFAYEFAQWKGGILGIGCVAGAINPFMTPCFYGAIVFTIACILSIVLLISLPKTCKQYYSTGMTRVLAFGAFDPLHEGHKNFLQQAKDLGDHLTVVVAHDSAILANKHREQFATEEERVAAVKAIPYVDEVMLGKQTADRYQILGELDYDVVALGHNQKPSDEEVREALNGLGKYEVKIVRCKAYMPDLYS